MTPCRQIVRVEDRRAGRVSAPAAGGSAYPTVRETGPVGSVHLGGLARWWRWMSAWVAMSLLPPEGYVAVTRRSPFLDLVGPLWVREVPNEDGAEYGFRSRDFGTYRGR